MAQEGQELAKASFGPTILLAIGKAYEGQAAIYLGGFIQGGLASIRQEGQSIKSKVQLGMMGLKVFHAQQKLEQMDKDQKQRSEAQARVSQQSTSPNSIPAGINHQPGQSPEHVPSPCLGGLNAEAQHAQHPCRHKSPAWSVPPPEPVPRPLFWWFEVRNLNAEA